MEEQSDFSLAPTDPAGVPKTPRAHLLGEAGPGEMLGETSDMRLLTPSRSAPTPAEAYQQQLGRVVGGYTLVALLGVGGFGAVFRGKHTKLAREAAIKILSPEAQRRPEAASRFLHEAQAAAKIGHPNIVEVFDIDLHPELGPYLVMELLRGQSLADAIKESPLSEARLKHIGAQLCSALAAAHEKGIIHRDLKPDNIFLIEREGQPDFVKLLDFGVAKLLHQEEHAKTATGSVLGTPLYMPPEQFEGKEVGPSSDVYSLGCVFFQALTQRVPFDGMTYGAIFKQHLLAPIPQPRKLRPELSPALSELVVRCLQKESTARFASMRALETELLQGPQRRPPYRVAAGALGLVALGVGLWLALQGEPQTSVAAVAIPRELPQVLPPRPAALPEERPAAPPAPLLPGPVSAPAPTGPASAPVIELRTPGTPNKPPKSVSLTVQVPKTASASTAPPESPAVVPTAIPPATPTANTPPAASTKPGEDEILFTPKVKTPTLVVE